MLHTLVVVVVVVVVGIKLQMNSRHVISCLTASLQLTAKGHLLPGQAWLSLAWPASSFAATQLREGSAERGCCNTFYGQRLGQLKSCKCSYFGFRLIVLRLSVAIASSTANIPVELLLSLDWFGKRQTNQEKVTNSFFYAHFPFLLELNSSSSAASSSFWLFQSRKREAAGKPAKEQQELQQFLPEVASRVFALLRLRLLPGLLFLQLLLRLHFAKVCTLAKFLWPASHFVY